MDRCNKDYNHRTILSCSILDEANRNSVIAIEISACIYQFGIFFVGATLSILIVISEIVFKKFRE